MMNDEIENGDRPSFIVPHSSFITWSWSDFMSKPRSRLADYLVYIAIRLFVCVIQAMPFCSLPMLANGLAWLAYRVDRRHRLVAIDNLQHAFPTRFTLGQLDRLVRTTYRHFCGVILEIIHLPRRINPYNCASYAEIPSNRQLVDWLLSDRPLLMVTGHFGNWEMAGYFLGLLGFTAHAVARPLDNPFVDEYLRRCDGIVVTAVKSDRAPLEPVPAFRVGSVLPESVTFTSLITMRVTTSLSAFTGSVLLARLIAPSGPARVCWSKAKVPLSLFPAMSMGFASATTATTLMNGPAGRLRVMVVPGLLPIVNVS